VLSSDGVVAIANMLQHMVGCRNVTSCIHDL